MDASIIIPAWEEEGALGSTLRQLEEVTVPYRTEVILIAGGDDGTFDVASEWSCRKFAEITAIEQEPSDGKEGALKKGMAEASGDYLLLLDADILVPADWLSRMVEELHEYDAVSCNFAPRERHWMVSVFYFVRGRHASLTSGTPGLAGAGSIGIRRNIVHDIGIDNLFTDRTTAGDDFYLHKVLSERGQTIEKVDDVTVRTILPETLYQFVQRWVRLHTVRYDIETDRSQLLELFVRSAAVVSAPPLAAVTVGHLGHSRADRGRMRFVELLIASLAAVVATVFITKIARRYWVVRRGTGLSLRHLPAYAIAEYLYHVGRVLAYLQRFLGLTGKVDHHFKREGG